MFKIKSIHKVLLALIAIFSLASVFRILFLGRLPVFVDEAALLVPSFSLRTAGTLFSLNYWQNGGIYQLYSIPFYLSDKPEVVLPIARLFYSVIPSIATVIISYFIFKQFYGKSVALLSSFFLSINAFSVLYSQVAIVYSLSLFLYLLIFLFFSKGLKNGKKIYLLLSLLLMLLVIQIGLPTVEICILLLAIYSVLHLFQGRKENKRFFAFKNLRSPSVLIFLSIVTIILIFFVFIGSIPFFLQNLKNLPLPETGFEKMFGFGSVGNASYSISHILDYLVKLDTLPLFLLSLLGLVYGFFKKDVLVISWSIALLPALYYGFYSRRMLFSAPLSMLLASVAISRIWSKLSATELRIRKSLKTSFPLKRLLQAIVVGLVIIFSVNSFAVSFSYVTDLSKSNAPSIEKEIYVSRYTSGYGYTQAIAYIESLSKNGVIITDTPQQFKYYLLNVSDRYEVLDLLTLNVTSSGLLDIFSESQKPIFLVVRWWNWVNGFLGNITQNIPGFPIKLATVVNIPESNIDDKMMIYVGGKNVVWKINDGTFSTPTKWEFNSSAVWDKYTLGWPQMLLGYEINRSIDNSLEMAIKGNSSWAWTVVGVRQINPFISEGNLTYNPELSVDINLLNQTSGSHLEIQLSLFDGVHYRNLVYLSLANNFQLSSAVFRNSSSSVYFVQEITLGNWTSINIDIRKDYESYFIDHDYNYGLYELSIGASTNNAEMDFLLRKAEINYDCLPWVLNT